MTIHTARLVIPTRGRGFVDITAALDAAVRGGGVQVGLCSAFIRHTSASLVVQENADGDVRRDLERFLGDLVPDGDRRYTHTLEGPDDMPAHVRAALTATSLTLPVRAGALALGTWQAVYLWEHRHAPHQRQVDVTVLG